MRAGPKPDPQGDPLDLRGLPRARGERAIRWIEKFCVVPKGNGALKPVKLRRWQREIVRGLLRDGVTQALVSVGRGNGKSMLAACLALYALYGDGEEGARVFVVASTQPQAALVFATCRRMVELSPALEGITQVHMNKLVVPSTDSVLEPLPATPDSLQGRDPSFVILDELAIVPDDTFESMALALGKREHSLLVAISTSPVNPESAMWRLRELGLDGGDPSFYFREFSAPVGCPVDDEECWKQANPALDDFLSRQALRSTLATVRESSFRRYRLNQITEDVGSWLDYGMWEALSSSRTIAAGSRVVAGFDGSVSGDSTCIVLATVEEIPHIAVYALWEAPSDPERAKGWRVPRHEVSEAVSALYQQYDVVEFAADPAYWRSEIEAWSLIHRGILEFPTWQVGRMAPATGRVYSMIKQGRLSHDGDPDLVRHLRNCVVRETSQGTMIQKFHKDSPRRIDLAVAMVIAVDRVGFHMKQPVKRRRVMAF